MFMQYACVYIVLYVPMNNIIIPYSRKVYHIYVHTKKCEIKVPQNFNLKIFVQQIFPAIQYILCVYILYMYMYKKKYLPEK